MGGLFSTSTSTDTTTSTLSTTDYEEQLALLLQKQEELAASVIDYEAANEAIIAAQIARQDEIASTRTDEILYTITRAEELLNARKALNTRASVLLCALLFNYPFGTSMDTTNTAESAWMTNASTIVNNAVTTDVFWLLCKVPQLVPLLWPTGRNDNAFHEYAYRDAIGNPDTADYMIEVNSLIDEYVSGNLMNYITNVFSGNCNADSVIDTDAQEELYNKCATFIESVYDVSNDTEFMTIANVFINENFTDPMKWKHMTSYSGKGICENTILLLPANYPKRSPQYELFEALLMLTNTVLNQYGQCLSSTGGTVSAVLTASSTTTHDKYYALLTETEIATYCDPSTVYADDDKVTVTETTYTVSASTPATTGGMCFELPSDWINNANTYAFADDTIWDGTSFISVSDIVIDSSVITSSSDSSVWMKQPTPYETLEVYYTSNADLISESNGLVRYKNPTRQYTSLHLNDIDFIVIPFTMPAISAVINETFEKSFLYNTYNTLTTVTDNVKYDVYRTNNKSLFTSMDYLTTRPPALDDYETEDAGLVSPTSRYIYNVLIENSCKWDLTVPLMNTMSMGQINNSIGTLSQLPQYCWRATNNITDASQTTSAASSSTAITQLDACDDMTYVKITMSGPSMTTITPAGVSSTSTLSDTYSTAP